MSAGASRQKDLEDRARNAGAFAAIFALLAGGGLAGVIPKALAVVAGGLAAAGLIAAWLFYVEARKAGQKATEQEGERQIAEVGRHAPVFEIGQVDPTQIGVDRAAQDILPGGALPEYVSRSIDAELREAIAAAFDGSGSWLVVVDGPSKVGKSRALFEALSQSASGRVDLVHPIDAAAMHTLLTPGDAPRQAASPEFRSWWARGWALRGRKPLWGLGFEGL